ncbi:hypothetical protein [Microbacterium abyssi]|uniref:hypothetical protein n=1 Tax=Microbacterium abyssi TaxID=2782166 RepID=UPI00188973C5|nr:hypothetical protein [Microbacterium sp. A18JL241]
MPLQSSWFWWIAAVVALGIFVWLQIEVSRSAVAPRTPWDEIHPLQIARLFSGAESIMPLSGSGYYPGWAILMTPIWWFTQDPATVYQSAVVLGNIFAAATIVPLTLIGRRLRITAPQAVAAAGIVMCLPGRMGAADYAMSEQALMFFYAWAVLGMFALWRRPSWWRLVLLVGAIAAAYLTHPRALALVFTAVVWLVFYLRRSVTQSVVGVTVLLVAWRVIDVFAAAVNAPVQLTGSNKPDMAISALLRVEPALTARVLFSQSWIQVVGTAGLFALGAVVIVVWMLREVRTLRLGPGSFLFGLTIATVAMSVVWWTRPDILWNDEYVRLDAWLYTRYIDHVAAFVCLVAIAALIRRVRASMIWIALGAFVLGAIAVVVRVAPDVPLWGVLSTSSSAINSWQGLFPDEPFHRPLLPTFTNENSFWLWGSLFAVVCLAAMFVLRRFPRVTVVVLLAIATGLSLTADLDQLRPAPVKIAATLEQADAAVGDGMLPVDFDFSCQRPGSATPQMLNWSGYWFAPREVHFADPPGGRPYTSDLVLSCHDNAELRQSGALRLKGDVNYGYRVWVRPGQLQDELSGARLLEE